MPGSNVIMHETDILVLGAGASGCGAAFRASESGLHVLLADKGRLESCGSLGGGNDHYMAVLNSGAKGDDLESIQGFYCNPKSGLSPDMIRQWVGVMPKYLKLLQDLGIEFKYNGDGSFYRTTGFGQPGSWWCHINNGKYIKQRFARHLKSKGIGVLEYFQCTKLLVRDGRAVGAAGFNVLDGSFHAVRARAVVLALGRTNCRSTANSSHMAFNTAFSPYITGSQMALAYEAGAELITLDTEQEGTLIPKGWGCPGMNGITTSGAKAMNALGERYMAKYHPMMEIGPRSLLVQGTHRELTNGSGPFHLNLMHIDADILRHLQHDSMPGDKETWNDYCEQAGIDFVTKPMEVELSEIYINGILRLKDNFESTTVSGLFGGSVFNDFSGSICSGDLAGGHAADYCTRADMPEPLDEAELLAEMQRVMKPLSVEDGIPHDRFENAIRQVMEYYMGYVRSGAGMELALAKLDRIAALQDSVSAAGLHELMRAHEAFHLLTLCRLTTFVTKERKESGSYIFRRADYPAPDPALDCLLVLRRENGVPAISCVRNGRAASVPASSKE